MRRWRCLWRRKRKVPCEALKKARRKVDGLQDRSVLSLAAPSVRQPALVGGILGADDRPRFREYVVRERRPSYRYDNDVRVGVVLPESGVTYYDVPAEYRAPPGYRYTIVNDRPVLIEPRTRRIVEVIE